MTPTTRLLLAILLYLVFIVGCQKTTNSQVEYIKLLPSDITLCGSLDRLSPEELLKLNSGEIKVAFDPSIHPRLIGQVSNLPLIAANDNRTPAGKMADDVLELNLEVVWGDFRVENTNRPGIRLAAIAESGKSPTIPAPLIRVETGTKILAQLKNTLEDSTIHVFGFQNRPSDTIDTLTIEPGGSKTVQFEAGEPGTYLYWIQLGNKISNVFTGSEDQLSGAFIIDPIGGSPPDRIFVMNIFSEPIDTAILSTGFLEALTINGKSWPYTERLHPEVGDTLRWRIINANSRNHPMHLHGFYYDVTSVGTLLKDDQYSLKNRRTIVTEFMLRRTTMSMEWVASRPGNWLFHCHLSFHVSPELRLPGISEIEKEHSHMAGLVLGIQIPDGPSDLISKGESRHLTLQANEYDTLPEYKYQFTLISDDQKKPLHSARPGPLLILKQYQDTYITLENNMTMATGIHWHGLELDSWADGVPAWSSSEGLTSPIVKPGEKFTYKLSLMRAGSFIYHTHLDDVAQLSGGLYGPLIVLKENEAYDPEKDHFYIVSWKKFPVKSFEDRELNGRFEQPLQLATVGETHRLRLMHIAPVGNITIRMLKNDLPVPIKFIAKDGADLPEHQQVDLKVSQRFGVGETADFAFTPTEPGQYELQIGAQNNPKRRWQQKWKVEPRHVLASLPN